MNLAKIESDVSAFCQKLIENKHKLGISFSRYPIGCCGDTSEILAAYLSERGHGQAEYLSGWRKGVIDFSHAWLELDGIIIDGTASQFGEAFKDSLISKDFNWYAQFSNHRNRRAPIDLESSTAPPHLIEAYEIIKADL